MHSTTIWAALVLAAGLCAQNQPWNQEELSKHLTGYLETGLVARLQTSAALVQQKANAQLAVTQRIHGNHHEYQLEIERLLEQLVDERWLKREEAERTLIESGANARGLIEARAKSGATLEERSRCQRILDRLADRGTEREDREIKMLRGLVSIAPAIASDDKMIAALRAASGHSDPLVADGALRSLGAIGGDSEADLLRRIAESSSADRRAVALAALGRMKAPSAVGHVVALVEAGKLQPLECIATLRDLRTRADAAPLVAALQKHADPRVVAAANAPSAEPTGKPAVLAVTLNDAAVLQVPILGMRGDCIVLDHPVEGLEYAEVPVRELAALSGAPAGKPAKPRAFLKRGSLVTGDVKVIDEKKVSIESATFGPLEIPRPRLQGLAFDPKLDRLLGTSEKLDKLRMRSGANVECTLVAMNDTSLVTKGGNGESLVPVADVAGVVFVRPTGSTAESGRYTRIELRNGDRLFGHLVAVSPSELVVHAPDLGTTKLPWSEVSRLEFDTAGGAVWGFTLVADYSENSVFEVDEQGKEVFRLLRLPGAWDAECLENGNLLITEFQAGRVRELTRTGQEVWAFTKLKNPYCARRLANGNTLIADTFANRVVEVDPAGTEVWTFAKGVKPSNCERLANGNTLIADMLKDRVIEVSPGGDIVWQVVNMIGVYDADRLPNGNTLVTSRTLNKVLEIDPNGKVVWQLANLLSPSDADRLPNGNTLVAENGGVREFDRNGAVVWKRASTWAVEANRY